MKNSDWLELLKIEDTDGNWEAYSWYLRDELDDNKVSDVVRGFLDKSLFPRYSQSTETWDWWIEIPYQDHKNSIINKEIFELLTDFQNFIKDLPWREYNTILDAKIALVKAYGLYKSTNPDLDAAPGE
jgi:hypothetical protein